MKPSDEEWFELQFDPSEAKLKYGIQVPEMPDEATNAAYAIFLTERLPLFPATGK